MNAELKVGWNKINGGSYVLLLPNQKKEFIPYSSYGMKNGHKYYQILMNPLLPSSQSVWYKTKNLDKAKEIKLRLVHRKYKKVLDFINNL
tara:strand:- start:1050 stop:1319 length:270 start_codon:yes stop_codon:yes gene_type:complete